MVEKLFGGVFAVIGIGLLVGSVFMLRSTLTFLEIAQPAEGVVIDLEYESSSEGGGTYYPLIRYTHPEKSRKITFRGNVGSSPPSYREGERVKILYHPDDPHNVRIDSFAGKWMGPLIMAIIGSVFSLFGVGLAVFMIRRARRIAWLRQHGRRIEARVLDVICDYTNNSTVYRSGRGRRNRFKNRRSANWTIIAEAKTPDGRTCRFESDPLGRDPGLVPGGDNKVNVLVDPNDPSRYWVEPPRLYY